uniref:Reverse transcriptase domain-containing protein n=1 Tax=Tanacetum cinerariifolium TaxID=118510 RepID=A0A699GRZ8_TANCI|nr:reverse transcriptase domain-containing protein [Tanacetum cinerariifolium]
MWESAKTVAPTSNSAIIQLDVDDNFVINGTHLNKIRENKFDGYLRADPHDHIREFLAICDMFKYGETQSEASLKEEMHEMRKNYNNYGGDHASKNDDTPMCERHEANYIQSEDEWLKSKDVCSKQADRTEPPPPPQAQTEHVNVVFTGSGKSDDSSEIQKDPPPPIIVNNKIKKDKPIKTSKRAITWQKQKNIHSVRVVEEYERIHEDLELKRRSKLKLKASRHLFTVLAITR